MTIKNAHSIPAELRDLKQWLLWKYETTDNGKPTKIPYQPNGRKANVTNVEDWCSFDEAFNATNFGGYDGIGFVLTREDPYVFIDLDDTKGNSDDLARQIKLHEQLDSYSEISPSGKGLHIIVKGKVPNGRRRSHIELYPHERYMTMTGNVYNSKPIAERQDMLDALYKQMSASPSITLHAGNEPQREDDNAIISHATGASNGQKFADLYMGVWEGHYQSQSEADFALIDIIAFYTQNREQIIRIFRASALGQRDKAKRADYVNAMVNRSFDKMLPKIDTEGFKIALDEKIAIEQSAIAQRASEPITAGSVNGKPSPFDGETVGSNPTPAANGGVAQWSEPSAHNGLVAGSSPAATTITAPPGLLGEIAHFVYNAAPRPVPEIAIAAAIGLMAGICGRAYNVSGTGLNQYILMIANTGAGKEGMSSGIDKLVAAIQTSVPVAPEFIGPSRIASGQALYKYLATKSQCFVSIVGEFGKRLEVMSHQNSNSAEKNLLIELLDLYSKSGHGQVSRPSIFADTDKNTQAIKSPALTILGESTPETFYGVISEELISDGLLPRFLLIEYTGPRPPLNDNPQHIPPFFLVDKLAELMAQCKTIMHNNNVATVGMTDEANKMLRDFDKFADNKINTTSRDTIRQLWNRAHIKLLKLSALVAIGVNYVNPIIEAEHVLWAKEIIESDIKKLSQKFEAGEIGKSSNEIKQASEIKRMISMYLNDGWEDIKKYSPDQRLHSSTYIPYSYLNKRLSNLVAFKTDKLGATNAIKRAIQLLIDSGVISEVGRKEMIDKFGTTQKCYLVLDIRLLKV